MFRCSLLVIRFTPFFVSIVAVNELCCSQTLDPPQQKTSQDATRPTRRDGRVPIGRSISTAFFRALLEAKTFLVKTREIIMRPFLK